MADRIKGITVQIGGDTTGLNKALSGVNKEIKNTQTQLKDVERLLKLDPSNTELLRQKQELLGKSVEETKKKLDALKEAEKQAQQQFADGKISQEQYDGLQREIAETEQKLKNLEKQADNSRVALVKIGEAGEKIKSAGEKISSAGKGLLPVTGAIAAIGTASIASFQEVDNGMDIIIKKTGATGEAAEMLQRVYKNVGETVPSSLSDVSTAIGEINTRFGFVGGELADCSKQFLKFAEINDIDVNSAVQLVSRAMGDAGIEASEYGTLLDELTVASQASGISIDKLTEQITKYGAPMRALGFDTQSSIAIFAQWEKAGVNTEIAFSGMKKAISNWMKEGKDAKKEFSNFIKGVQDGSIDAQEALEVFGAKAGPDLVDAIQQGRFSYEDFLKVIEDSKGTVDNTFEGTQDGIDKLQPALNTVKLAMAEFGQVISDALGPILEKLASWVSIVSENLANMDPRTKEMIVTAALIVAAIGPVLIIIGKIATGIGSIITVVSKVGPVLSGMQSMFSSVFSFIAANPVVLLIAAIVGLVALIATKGDQIQGMLQKLNDWLQGIFAKDWKDLFGPVLGEYLNAFFANVKNIWDSIKRVFDGIIDFVRGVFTGDWKRAWEGVKNIFGGIFDGLIALAKAPINGIIGILNMAINGINSLIAGINKISFDVPDWVPFLGGKTFGFSIPRIPNIPYLAKGGVLSRGSAIVGEAGPELLTMMGNRAMVQPLTSQTNTANLGGVNIVVYGAPGQDVKELAEIIMDEMESSVQRKGAVFA